MLKKPRTITLLLGLILAIPAAAVLIASDGPDEDQIVVLPDSDPDMDMDMDFDIEVDNGHPVVVKLGGKGGGFVGVQLIGITPELREHFGVPKDAGVLVGDVESDSPAARAGIQVGDILTAVDGERIDSSRDLSRAVRSKKAGETVKIDLSRKGARKQLTVTLAERPEKEIRVGDLSPRMKKRAWVWHDGDFARGFGPLQEMGRVEERLDELERRLQDLEKKLPQSK